MQTDQVHLVRATFAAITPSAPHVAAVFYDHLFDADPSLRPLFRGDMALQGERLMNMIANAVDLLQRPDALRPVLQQLGARHAAYGVAERHYATVGGALLRTLEQGLGRDYTPQVRDAWAAVYGTIAETMIEGARRAQAIAP